MRENEPSYLVDLKRRGRFGLTLIEIMTVLVILGIISAIVLPGFGGHDDLKVASASRELVANLLYAQSRAIATGHTAYVQFDPARGKYQILESMNPPRVMLHPASRLPYDVGIGTGELQNVTLTTAGLGAANVLAFDSAGSPCAFGGTAGGLLPLDGGSIVLSCGGVQQTVFVQPLTGEIKVR